MDKTLDHPLRRNGLRRPQGKRERQTRLNAASSLHPYRAQRLSMPEQDLRQVPQGRYPVPIDVAGNWRRLAILLATLALTMLFAWKLYTVLSIVRVTPLQIVFLALSTLAFGWIALGTVSAVAGFAVLITRKPSSQIRLPEGRLDLHEKTALLCPIYHEDPERVAATIMAMAREIDIIGASRAFSFFVLSDSRTSWMPTASCRRASWGSSPPPCSRTLAWG